MAKSWFCVPDPPIETRDARWRRFEFIITNVLSVGRPRSWAGRIKLPVESALHRLNDGTSVPIYVGVSVKHLAGLARSTSTGTGESSLFAVFQDQLTISSGHRPLGLEQLEKIQREQAAERYR